MMNLQRLEEVRNNLNNLVSIASIIGPQDDVLAEVQAQLAKIGAIRLSYFDEPRSVQLIPSQTRATRPACAFVVATVQGIRAHLEQIRNFRIHLASVTKPEPRPEPKPEPKKIDPRFIHNHVTRDIKPRGKCPGCDEYHDRVEKRAIQVRKPERFEVPPPPPAARKVPASSTYNPDRYVPYKVLWAKVIIRAAYDYALWKDSKDLRLRKFAQDAERWLFEPSDVELSFENICSTFDFPIERIRARTRTLTKADVKKLEFRERQGRIDPGELTSGYDE